MDAIIFQDLKNNVSEKKKMVLARTVLTAIFVFSEPDYVRPFRKSLCPEFLAGYRGKRIGSEGKEMILRVVKQSKLKGYTL
jgi:hypothetical protein